MLTGKIFYALASLALGVLAQYPNPQAVTGDTAIHDPSMCKDSSGKYWLFGTGVGIEIRTSTDRKAWTLVGKVWPDGASWADTYTGTSNGALWAPDCTYADGQFYLYYAASSFGSQNSAIFFAKSTTGLPNSWVNEGLVTSTSSSNDYNIQEIGISRSAPSGRELKSSSTGKPSSSTVTSLAERTAANGAIEASVIYEYGSYYYLFTSWDLCCQGTNSTYNIRVGRSSSVKGPFVDESGVALTEGGGTLILGSHGSIIGPGGQDILTDSDGILLIYHYYTSSGSFLGINHLDFSSGWPIVTS
ncbi:hypothetical protein EW146_g3976 [Bondarzewia mesenterica]|uniref:arabinan endo-1,5-alpha-L-arabinosidase n=1 Tax=Bondarzewia mesenterica TaxID=1095465 RepID=A0A4S4LW36_9AGAM|nr:hypothetical protein EW146_g3976 [Bondarzewia mesenterica]